MDIRSAAKLPKRVQIVFPEDEGRTRQSMQDECDINKIMAVYQKTGAISHYSRHGARYGFADSLEFHDALNIVKEADRMFGDLPSVLRQRFPDPGAFLEFVQDEANAEEMVELGLRDPGSQRESLKARIDEKPPAGVEVPAVAPEAPAAPFDASD